MSLHVCVGCETAMPFHWNLKNLPFCDVCFEYLKPTTDGRPVPLGTHRNLSSRTSEIDSNEDQNTEFFAAFSSHGVSHTILRHWKKNAHTCFENEIFKRARPALDQLVKVHRSEKWDVIVPIPQKTDRAFFLGGGPARRIAHRLSRRLEIPIIDILEKENLNHTPQAKKTLQERFESPLDFRVRTDHEVDLIGKRALLVDDFMTSGQTLRQAKLALIRGGFDDVRIFVLGHRPHFFNGDT